jgi:hypothetical protein
MKKYLICPLRTSKQWRSLEVLVGEREAAYLWNKYDGNTQKIFSSLSNETLLRQASDVKGLYSIVYESDPKQVLSEIADQLKSSKSESDTALRIVGETLAVAAQEIYGYGPSVDDTYDTFSHESDTGQGDLEIPQDPLNLESNDLKMDDISEYNVDNAEVDNEVDYQFSGVAVILDNLNKIYEWESNKLIDDNTLWNKIQQLGVPKDQLQLIKNSPGTSIDEKVASFIVNYTYNVEINTAKDKLQEQNNSQPTQYYANLTAPGGTKYTENRIDVPKIIAAIKAHARFALDYTIGWFRSDDRKYTEEIETEELENDEDETSLKLVKSYPEIGGPKTRRILEVQADLFQKGRDKSDLADLDIKQGFKFTTNKGEIEVTDVLTGTIVIKNLTIDKSSQLSKQEFAKLYKDRVGNSITTKNDFLQLLNKDNNWVTFFIKSIIQDSAKKGYEKVLFPTGNTASKVEGHTTLEEFKKQKEDRIKFLDGEINDPENIERRIEEAKREKEQVKQELERIETEGFGALKPIFNFYENTVFNILKKQGYGPVSITDEYGNTWYEVVLSGSQGGEVLFQRAGGTAVTGSYFDNELAKKIQNKLETLYPEIKLNITNTPIFEEGSNIFNQDMLDAESRSNIFKLTENIRIANRVFKISAAKNKMAVNTTANVLISDAPLKYLSVSNQGIVSLNLELLSRDIKKELGNSIIPEESIKEADEWSKSINDTTEPEKQFIEYKTQIEGEKKYYEGSLLRLSDLDRKQSNELFDILVNTSIYPRLNDIYQSFSLEGKDGNIFTYQYKNGKPRAEDEYSNFILLKKITQGKHGVSIDHELFEDEDLQIEANLALQEFKKDKERIKKAVNKLVIEPLQRSLERVSYNLNSDTFKSEFISNVIAMRYEQLQMDENDILTWGLEEFVKRNLIANGVITEHNELLKPFGFTVDNLLKLTQNKEYQEFVDKKNKLNKILNNKEKYNDDYDNYEQESDILSPVPGWFLNAVSVANTGKYFDDHKGFTSGFVKGVIYLDAQRQYDNLHDRGVAPRFQKILDAEDINDLLVSKINFANTINLSDGLAILNQKDRNRILGQANIKAMTVLVDAINQKQDTLPHEYAHHYIAWYRNTPIVQEAIKKWGSEEVLVQSIGEQVVKQKGEAYNWWKKFTNWVMNQFNSLSGLKKEELTNLLTDAFLTRKDLNQPLQSVKPGVEELFDSNPELANIGTVQQYSQYLDTIFPDSKMKDIVYHGTNETFETFDKNKKGSKTSNLTNQLGFYFGDKEVAQLFNSLLPKDYSGVSNEKKLDDLFKSYSERYGKEKANEILTELMSRSGYGNPKLFERVILPDSVTLPVILNITNPAKISTEEFAASTRGVGKEGYDKFKNIEKTNDGILLQKIEDAGVGGEEFEYGRNFVVFEPEQIHLLGSKQDIDGFKSYINKSKISDISNLGKLDGDFVESEKGQIGVNKQQLLMLLGPTMYNKPLADVAVKELLQNSFDAIKARQNITTNKGVGNIDIIVNYDNRTIAIKDDGIGMTPDIVKNAFLSIGGTNKEGLDVSERSGGFGLAKVQFLLGSEYVKVATVRDGVKTSLEATAIQLYNDDFVINKDQTNEPNGSYVEVKIPESYTTPEGTKRDISFPGMYRDGDAKYKAFDILDKPLIGDVNVSFTHVQHKETHKKVIPIGKNTTEETLPPLFSKIDFSWGSADLYMSVEKNTRPSHKILSSGIFQFSHSFSFKDWEDIPYDIVVNIKPSVTSTSEQYPFNNQREGFKNTVKEDIKSLNNYLKKYALGEADKDAKAAFSSITGLPKVDPNKVLTPEEREKLYADVEKTIAENKQKRIDSNLGSVEEEVRKIWKLVIDEEGVKDAETGVLEVSNEKNYNSSFKADKKIESVEAIETTNFNPALPQYHNNTNFNYLEVPGAAEFFSDFGSVVLEFVRFAGNELGYSYKKLKSEEEKFFAGVSIDKQYGGVHVRKIINAIFVNPLAFDVQSLEEAVGVALHVAIHEVNHTTVSGEGASFTTALGILYGKIYATGKYGLYEGLFRSVYKKHFETFKKLKYEYEKSSTRNLSESFSGDQIERNPVRNVQRDAYDVQAGQTSERGYSRDQEDNTGDRTGDVILANLSSKVATSPQQIKNMYEPTLESLEEDNIFSKDCS